MMMTTMILMMMLMCPVKRRAAASLLGSCVADAASRPLHWIYDKEKLATLLAQRVRDRHYQAGQCLLRPGKF